MSLTLLRWLWAAQLRRQPGRLAAASVAIALGVALALAIHLVNRSALDDFQAALAAINGEAQARIEARAGNLDEALWAQVAVAAGVAEASPVIETELPVLAPQAARLRIVGIDPMRAARVAPALLPSVAGPEGGIGLFDDDAIFLSPRALTLTGTRPGDRISLASGSGPVELRVAGTLTGAAGEAVLAVMDLGTLQWRLGWLGRLSRIDLRLAPGVSPAALTAGKLLALPDDVIVSTPEAASQRMSNLSRAYRVNLNVLALVALFTGVFIVHSTMSLTAAREASQMAVLAMLGARRRLLRVQMLGLGLLPGVVGSMLGLVLGTLGARLLLTASGGDLGGGYFPGDASALSLTPATLSVFALAGIATALLGSLVAAQRVSRRPPAAALKSGLADNPSQRPGLPIAVPITLAAAGGLLLAAPPVGGLPLPAYAAIAAWLLAGIALLPHLLRALAPLLQRDRLAAAGPLAWLAAQRVAASPGHTAAALGGIVAAIALACAMAVMVTSFRGSVERWLEQALPADLYGRIDNPGPNDGFDPALQAHIAALPGITRTEFLHSTRLVIDSTRPPVTLLARPIDADAPEARLPITGSLHPVPPDAIPVWASEAAATLYGWQAGATIQLPVPDSGLRNFFVSGIWRDYARQHGAVAIDLADWQRLAGPAPLTDLSLWLRPGVAETEAIDRVRALVAERFELTLRSAAALRATSLRIFDRSFAATWALEAVAIAVALFGVATAWSAEAIARRHEFGILRRLGLRPTAIAAQFALEASLLAAAAVAWGFGLGAAIALVLVHRVNPQSFHWTMDVEWPLSWLAVAGLAMVVLAALVAALAGRQAGGAASLHAPGPSG